MSLMQIYPEKGIIFFLRFLVIYQFEGALFFFFCDLRSSTAFYTVSARGEWQNTISDGWKGKPHFEQGIINLHSFLFRLIWM